MNDTMKNNKMRIFASPRNWVEGEAVRQLENAAGLPGMVAAVGMPDIHPGKGCPVGAAFMAEGIIYPHLVGNDAGCGMALWKTDIPRHKANRDKWAKKLFGLESPWDGDTAEWLGRHGIDNPADDQALGTIGGGNHFAEIQMFDTVLDQERFSALQLEKDSVMILVHSGSRGVGDALLRRSVAHCGANGLPISTDAALQYLDGHDYALKWAAANRALIAHRLSRQLRCDTEGILDLCHNSIMPVEADGKSCWLHRKGAAPSDGGAIVIPGTRGSLSYLVVPTGDQRQNIWSVAHGAGRKWNRQSVRERLQSRHTADSLTRTEVGSHVICEDRDLLFEEAPQAYKNIDIVIDDMVAAGLVSVVATLKPVITYKVRKR